MSNSLSPELLAQLLAQESSDPFLTLVTLSHSSFPDDIRLVNNTVDIVSNGETFTAFPMRIMLPTDDGETDRQVSLELDNISLELITEIRSVTNEIGVKLHMILASIPNDIQYSLEELKISQVTYDKNKISCKLIMDNFLTVGLTSERYTPTNFPGLF